jgi:bisphosphoglycerate-independent phosphoglycerate mutase (AlkP superfamily)
VQPPAITHTSGEYAARSGLRTFACSETQKFGHVTFFWNGNRSGYFDERLEEYVEVPSDKCIFNEKPLMKAREITDAALAALRSGRFDVLRINYANPDMVGHTGDLAATVAACEECDACLGELLAAVDEHSIQYSITQHSIAAALCYARWTRRAASSCSPRTTATPMTWCGATSRDHLLCYARWTLLCYARCSGTSRALR